jgi:hypothetical protein
VGWLRSPEDPEQHETNPLSVTPPQPSRTASSDHRPATPADPHFLPVAILPDPTPSITDPPAHLELILPNGRRIAVAPGFDPQTLRRLIAAVEGPPCSD